MGDQRIRYVPKKGDDLFALSPEEHETQVNAIAHHFSEMTDDQAPLNYIHYKIAAQAFLTKYDVIKKE